MFTFSVLALFLHVLSKNSICHFDGTWLISQQFACTDLKPEVFLVAKLLDDFSLSYLQLSLRVPLFGHRNIIVLITITFLKKFVNFTGKHQRWNLFLMNLQTWKPATLLKGNSNTVVFLWILNSFFIEYFLWLRLPEASTYLSYDDILVSLLLT